jgi:hypothetical protein
VPAKLICLLAVLGKFEPTTFFESLARCSFNALT